MNIRTKLANLIVRWLVGGKARWVDIPRPAKGFCKSAARTPANAYSLKKKIGELESFWRGLLQSWDAATLLTAAKMLARGDDPGFDTAFLRPATAVLMLRELQRRWESEAADELRATVKAEATAASGPR